MTRNVPNACGGAIRWAVLCTILIGSLSAQPLEPGATFQQPHKRAAARLIESVSGPSDSDHFLALDRRATAAFLDSFWVTHNPLLHRYYFGPHLGQRHYSISDAFFERGDLIPKEFHTGFPLPDSAVVEEALRLSKMLVEWLPTDPIALAARGYLLLETGRNTEADSFFIEAIKIDERFAEAHNGRGLSYLPRRKRLMEALYHFRDAIASDEKYAAAMYDLAMCHLAMGSIDLDHRFGMVVRRFPNHHDAYFKLGVAYENLYDYKRSAGAYSSQLIGHPDHKLARARLARVNLEMSWTNKRHYDIPEVEALVEKDRLLYLPLLAETHLAKRNYERAERTYARFFNLIRKKLREIYADISLLVPAKEAQRLASADPKTLLEMQSAFWLMNDPTPTTPTNERRLEHYRRVHYALQNFGLVQKPWDKRGEVYIRLGHPDHRSWSGNLVFETDPDVVRVKNRLNDRTFEIRGELLPSDLRVGGEGLYPSYQFGEIRGFPVFPIPHTGSSFRDGASLDARWESWIYAKVDGGLELSFIDYLGDGRFDFARVPQSSPNVHIWLQLAPETVFAKALSSAPSHFTFDYGGAPLTLHVDHASFRGNREKSVLELYFGVPRDEIGLEMRGDAIYGRFDRKVVVYDGSGKVVYRDSTRLNQRVIQTDDSNLLVSQIRVDLVPGPHIIGVRVRDPGTGKTQVLLKRVDVSDYSGGILSLSDIEVARVLVESGPSHASAAFRKGDLHVMPHPSRTFRQGKPVYLYYEVYDLLRDRNGQTRYRVDYEVRGGAPYAARRLFGRVARFLGREIDRNRTRISYEHEGFSESEPLYVALDLTAEGKGDVDVEIVVTDLKHLDEPSVSRHVHLTIGE